MKVNISEAIDRVKKEFPNMEIKKGRFGVTVSVYSHPTRRTVATLKGITYAEFPEEATVEKGWKHFRNLGYTAEKSFNKACDLFAVGMLSRIAAKEGM